MTKICFLGDTHFGARNDNKAFHEYFERFYSECFFPYLDQNDIKTVIQFGDLFDRRKYINFFTLSQSRRYFFDELAKRNIDLHVFVGNHDVFFKNTNEINSPELVLSDYNNVHVYTNPTELNITGDLTYALLPWVCSGNYTESMEFVKNTSSPILLGHLELAGFEMYKGVYNDHGMDMEVFNKFDIVATGHFHHRSTRGNITYLGTPYELTWSDYNDSRGFYIFDEETRDLEFVENPFSIFHKIYYDDTNMVLEDIKSLDFSKYKDTYVKVVIKNKMNPYWFDMFIEALAKTDPADYQVVEDHLNLSLEDDEDIVDEAEDTLTILRKYVDQMETNIPKKQLDNFLISLYSEAMQYQ